MELALVVMILLFIYGLVSFRLTIIHPLFIYLSINVAVILFYIVSDFKEISSTTMIVFLGSILSFVLGYKFFLGFLSPSNSNENQAVLIPLLTRRTDLFVLFISTLFIFGMAKQGLINASNGESSNFFLNLRLEHIKNPALFWFYPHMVLFTQFYLLVKILTRFNDDVKLLCFSFLFISCYGSFWQMERTGVIMSIISLVVVMLIRKTKFRNEKIEYMSLIAIALGIVIFFMLITIIRSNTNLLVAFNSLAEYFTKPLYTFDSYVLVHESSGDYSKYFGAIGDALFKPFFYYEKVDIYVEDLFNVYTYLEAPFVFGGRYLNFFTMFVFGGIYALIYNQVVKLNVYMSVYYSFFIFPLVMSFFSYIFSWNHWIYYFLILIIMRLTFKHQKVLINDRSRTNHCL